MLYLIDNDKNRVIGFYESPKGLKRGMDLLANVNQLPNDYHISTDQPECFTSVKLDRPKKTKYVNTKPLATSSEKKALPIKKKADNPPKQLEE